MSLLERMGCRRIARGTGAADATATSGADPVRASDTDGRAGRGPLVAVVTEPGRQRLARELLGEAAQLAGCRRRLGRVLSATDEWAPEQLDCLGSRPGGLGRRARTEEDVAGALASWCQSEVAVGGARRRAPFGEERSPAGALRASSEPASPGTRSGSGSKKVGSSSWKPAFGGRLVAAITASSAVQMATVRPGVLELRSPRAPVGRDLPVELSPSRPKGGSRCSKRVATTTSRRCSRPASSSASAAGVRPRSTTPSNRCSRFSVPSSPASRKVTDKGWLPRARQVGITGHSIAPALYVALGVQGKFNHVIGTRSAGTVLAVNLDAEPRSSTGRTSGSSPTGATPCRRSWRSCSRELALEVEVLVRPDDDLSDVRPGPAGDREDDGVGHVARGAQVVGKARLSGCEHLVG